MLRALIVLLALLLAGSSLIALARGRSARGTISSAMCALAILVALFFAGRGLLSFDLVEHPAVAILAPQPIPLERIQIVQPPLEAPSEPEPATRTIADLLWEAGRARSRHERRLEREFLLEAEALAGTTDSLAEVQWHLVYSDRLFPNGYEEARARLERLAAGPDGARALVTLAELEVEAKDFAAARVAAGRTRGLEARAGDRRVARLWWNAAAVREAVELRLAGEEGNTPELRSAFDDLVVYGLTNPGDLDPTRLQLQAALLLDDGPAALKAWGSYFRAPTGHPQLNAIASAARRLEQALRTWRGPEASSEERIALVESLAGTRCFEEALLVARDPHAPSAVRDERSVEEIDLYASYLRELPPMLQTCYRSFALGEGEAGACHRMWKQRTAALSERLWPARDGSGAPDHEMLADLERRFGTHINFANHGDPSCDLFVGHSIVDRTCGIEQYGERAEPRLVVLDTIVSRDTRLFNGPRTSVAGFASSETIWMVRPAHTQELPSWRLYQWLAEAISEEFEDARRLMRFADGISFRLWFQGMDRLAKRLHREGRKGTDFRDAFLSACEDLSWDRTFQHEARHVLDQRAERPLPDWWLEYYADLSTIAFAANPRLAAAQSLVPRAMCDCEDACKHHDPAPGPHAKAEESFTRRALAWMEENIEEIRGLDPEQSLLQQFDLLTDDQIRTLAREIDPLARGR